MRTLSYILLSSMLLLTPASGLGKEKETSAGEDSNYKFFSLNGMALSVDLFGGVNYLVNRTLSSEVALEMNIGNRLYPIAEVGYGLCNTTDATSEIHYKTQSPYYRVGFNYNFFTSKKKPNPKNYIYGIIRFGWSNFNYDVDTPPITDPVWGNSTELHLKDVKGECLWGEVGAGVKVRIAKFFHMGWSVRYKLRLSQENGPNSKMWYIPGFGINKSNGFSGTYNLIFNIPFKKQQ